MEQIHVETSNLSHNLQDPSKMLSNDLTDPQMSSDQPNDMTSDQGLSALHSKQPVDVKLQAKGTLQNISSLTDATVTTMGDSAIQLPSQNLSQPGTLNTIENLTNYEKAGEEGLQEPDKLSNETPAMKLIRLSESPTQTTLSKKTPEPETEQQKQDIAVAEPEAKETLVKESMEGQGAIESGVNGPDQSSALFSQQENIKTENTRQVQIESPNSKKQLERVTSLENLANQTKQAENDPGTTTPAQIRFYTDHSESRSFGTPNQQFTSDQHDSEGYISRNRAGSSRNESGLSSTEDSKVQELPKKEPAAVAKPKISLADFHKVAVLGRGSYGEVSLVKKISNNKLYALKAIDKYFMKKEHKEHQVYVEKEVLMKSNHPNIIKFYSSFQDKKKLYFVLEYVGGGEFSDYLRAQRKLRKEEIAFFTAEVINILEYLHSNNIAHRDIKPENLLLTIDGHLKCIDFGTAQFMTEAKTHKEEPQPTDQPQNPEGQQGGRKESSDFLSHRKTFVGTAQYVSPEMLEHSECDTAADLWALGCMVYVMAIGRYPFEDSNEFLIFQKIQNIDISYPLDLDPQIKDLIEKLLKKEPHERLGAGAKGSANDVTALKAHPLFTGIDFAKLHKAKAPMAEIVSPHRQRDQFATFSSPIEDPIQKLVPNRKHFLSEDLQTLEEKTGKTPAPSTSTAEVKERIILSGLVLKKCGWLFFRPRQLVLNSKPRLVYYDPETNQLKGEIPLEPGTVAELESKQKWIIHTPKKKYFFKEMEHSAEKWVETINQIAAQLNQKKV